MSASLKTIDPELKVYLKVHRITQIYEALLSGLAIMCPTEPLDFIVEKLQFLKDHGLHNLEWDMFIADEMKPFSQILTESNLDSIFNFDDNLQPTAEMYVKAYDHYNKNLKVTCFHHWMQFHLKKREKKLDLFLRVTAARTHYKHRIYRETLLAWREWINSRYGRQAVAYNILEHVYNVSIGRIIFEAWRQVTVDTKKTREYFERLERGENMHDEDGFGGSGEARDDISMLPRDITIKIFSSVDISDLARCACVCRSWKVITQWSALWSKLDLSRLKTRITDKVAAKLLSKCRPYLIHLNLRGCNSITKLTFTSVRECRNLQDLNLSECIALNDDVLKTVLESCKILLYLNVSYSDITDASLRVLAKNCYNLQYLSIAGCKRFTDAGLYYIASGKGARKLVYLDVSGCIQITPNGFNNLAQGCSHLQTLILDDLFTLDDLSGQYLAERVKSLRTISLLGSPNVSDEALKKLAQCKKIQRIKIDSNQKISDATLKSLGRHCSGLRHIYLTDCHRITDLGVKALSSCANLTVINFADCVRITDQGVRHLVESSCGAKIRELNLSNCLGITDVAVININKRCHNLAYLSLCFCEHIREAGIELLGQTHSLTALDISGCKCGDVGVSALGSIRRLRQITLSECEAITDLGLQKFAQQVPEIQRLELAHCQNISDAAMKNLAFCCRMLTHLNLAGCSWLTDLSIQYLSGVCHYLQYLDISGSLHITDKALLKYLRKGCKNLNTLIMYYCPGISKDATWKMSKNIPNVYYSGTEAPASFYDGLKFQELKRLHDYEEEDQH